MIQPPTAVSVTVSGGSGNQAFSLQPNGYIKRYAFVPPSGSASYNWQILDYLGLGVNGSVTTQTGTFIVSANDLIIYKNTLYITGASQDGVYQVVLYYDSQY